MDLFIEQTEENYRALTQVAAFVGSHRELTVNDEGVTFHAIDGEKEEHAIQASIQRFVDNPA